ncbi:MAG TPA: hypothetical protein G4O08_02850 [Anaerolineae bacterium]|nr:hypothetical protein [Anaerolineae bacterium]
MKCGQCGTENPEEYKFCKECGVQLAFHAAPPSEAKPTTIIIRERERRGVPGYLWALLGMILLVLLCALLVWLDIVDVPDAIRARLPEPLENLVDRIDPQDRPQVQDPGPPGIQPNPADPPDDQDQDDQQQDDDNQGDLPRPPDDGDQDRCDEDLAETFSNLSTYCPEFGSATYIDFEFWESFQNDQYLVYILDGEYDTPEPWMTQFAQNKLCNEGSWYDDGMFHLCQDTPLEYTRGMKTFVFYDFERDCFAGLIPYFLECDSGQYYYAQMDGCCTAGCMCTLPGGGYGCWQSCAPQCVED